MCDDRVLKLFNSKRRTVRVRAAQLLLNHSQEAPLSVLLKILDDFHQDGLGAGVERALSEREDPEITNAMMRRLRSPAPFIREAACNVLGKRGGPKVTSLLLGALEDEHCMVRRAAAFALANIGDRTCASQLLKRYKASAGDDINVRSAMECALDQFGVSYTKHP